jgi:hypothetical protein
MEDENNNNQHSPNRFSLTDPSNQDLDLSNLSVKPLLNSLSPNLRLKILSPPKAIRLVLIDQIFQQIYFVFANLIPAKRKSQQISLTSKKIPSVTITILVSG